MNRKYATINTDHLQQNKTKISCNKTFRCQTGMAVLAGFHFPFESDSNWNFDFILHFLFI